MTAPSVHANPPDVGQFSPSQWREAVQGATNEIARYALGFTGAEVGAPGSMDLCANMVGAHIPVIGRQAYDFSLFASESGCSAIATAVLGMNPADLPPGAVADAIGEIVNQLAGGVKRRLTSSGGDLELGLPVFIRGVIELTGRQTAIALPVQLGPISVVVAIIGSK